MQGYRYEFEWANVLVGGAPVADMGMLGGEEMDDESVDL